MGHLDMPMPSDGRIECLLKFKDGYFKRESTSKKSIRIQDIIQAFPTHVRSQMDDLIDNINKNVLKRNGYPEMPVHLYHNYRKVCTYL